MRHGPRRRRPAATRPTTLLDWTPAPARRRRRLLDRVRAPRVRPLSRAASARTYTAAAVLLADHALYGCGRSAGLFRGETLPAWSTWPDVAEPLARRDDPGLTRANSWLVAGGIRSATCGRARSSRQAAAARRPTRCRRGCPSPGRKRRPRATAGRRSAREASTASTRGAVARNVLRERVRPAADPHRGRRDRPTEGVFQLGQEPVARGRRRRAQGPARHRTARPRPEPTACSRFDPVRPLVGGERTGRHEPALTPRAQGTR